LSQIKGSNRLFNRVRGCTQSACKPSACAISIVLASSLSWTVVTPDATSRHLHAGFCTRLGVFLTGCIQPFWNDTGEMRDQAPERTILLNSLGVQSRDQEMVSHY
jgi:hypothetical protein